MLGFSELIVIIAVFGLLYVSRMFQSKAIDYHELEMELLNCLNDNSLIAQTKDPKVETILSYLHGISNSNLDQYKHFILLEDEINAMALPSGTILITKGFLSNIEDYTDDEIASVLAHEISHIELGHAKSRIENTIKTGIFEDSVKILSRNIFFSLSAQGLSFLHQQLFQRDQEYEADNYAVSLLRKSKYDPRGFITLLEKFQRMDNTPEWLEIINTHPHLEARISNIVKQLGSI
jgi:putative metalloprotease